ncbi:MAG: type IV pilus assembly protein PilM [Vicinamibacterales bacterium]
MPVFRFGQSPAVIGLDIGSSAIKAIELQRTGRGRRVAAYAMEPVPPGSIADGSILDPPAVAAAVRRVLSRGKFSRREVCVSLSGSAVIVKKINLPVMTPAELADSIVWEAEQYIPFDAQDVNLDYQILDAGTGPDARGIMEVLLVAAKKDKTAEYTSVVAAAGRTPVVVDVDAFALQNAFEANYGLEPEAVIILLNAGASAVNINVLQHGRSVFTRDISVGGNAYREALQRELGVSPETADRVKRSQAVEGVNREDVGPVLRAVTEHVLLEVQKTFDFFRTTAEADRIDRLVVSGGASRIDGFAAMLQARFGVEAEELNPFRAITWDSARLGGDALEAAPVAAVAVGLGLRTIGDR